MSVHTNVISLRIPDDLKNKLDKLVKHTKRSRADLLQHWIEDGIELEEWQLSEIEAGINEANEGIFASTDDINKVFNKWL